MLRTLPLFGSLALALALGCSAIRGGSPAADGETAGASSSDAGTAGSGAGAGAGGGQGGSGFGFGGTGPGGQGGNDCISDGDEDKDQDGFSVNAGDCNDCDGNVNPGSIEVQITEPDMNGVVPEAADEDCDGQIDNVAPLCDDGLSLTDTDPKNGARAVDLCQFVAAGEKKWGVVDAAYVRADGSSAIPPNPLQYGILDAFGPNVNTQGGARMLALSSGYSRLPGQPGACGGFSCSSNFGGTPPVGFPQDVSGCAGGTAINDDVALNLRIRAPTNATGYSFNFKFYSFEYPEFVCTQWNDQYISLVDPPPVGSVSGNISFDKQNNPVSVNVAFFDVCPGCLLGDAELKNTGFDTWNDAGGTGWLKTQAPVTGGSEFTIRFAIWDTGDSAWDSTTLVDNFRWVANGGTVAVGTEPIPDPK